MFTKIDFKKWERAERFNHFFCVNPCDYNLTSNIDISNLLALAKAKGIKLYPALIFVLTSVVNEIEEMRLGFNEKKELGFFDVCHPSYTISNASESSFSGIWSFSKKLFSDFYKLYLQDTKEFSSSTAYAPKADQPKNTFYVSCTPQIAFTSLSLNLYNGAENLTPMFTLGKFFSQGDRTLIPLAAHFHHAACDGFHVARFFEKVQQWANDAERWLSM